MNHTLTLKSSRYIDAPLFLRVNLLWLNWDNALLEGRNKPSYHVKGEKHPDGSYFLPPRPPLAFNIQQLSDLMRNFVNGQSSRRSYLAPQISGPLQEKETQ